MNRERMLKMGANVLSDRGMIELFPTMTELVENYKFLGLKSANDIKSDEQTKKFASAILRDLQNDAEISHALDLSEDSDILYLFIDGSNVGQKLLREKIAECIVDYYEEWINAAFDIYEERESELEIEKGLDRRERARDLNKFMIRS